MSPCRAFAAAIRSCTEVTANEGWTTSTFEVSASGATAVKSLSYLNRRLGNRLSFTAKTSGAINSVWPSFGARATASLAILPDAPGAVLDHDRLAEALAELRPGDVGE